MQGNLWLAKELLHSLWCWLVWTFPNTGFFKYLTQKVFCTVLHRLLVESLLNLEAFCVKLLLFDGNLWTILSGMTTFVLGVKTHLHWKVVVHLLQSVKINLNLLCGITYHFSKYFGFAVVNIEGFVIVWKLHKDSKCIISTSTSYNMFPFTFTLFPPCIMMK
jgi:hypothetical protein